jgi:hypothetical protein
MADGIEHLTERVQSVEEQVVHLTGRVQIVEEKVDQLSTSMNHRFDAVDAAFVEQRQYIEFAYARLDDKVVRLDDKVVRLDEKVERLDAKMDTGFERIELKLDRLVDPRRPRRIRKPRR